MSLHAIGVALVARDLLGGGMTRGKHCEVWVRRGRSGVRGWLC